MDHFHRWGKRIVLAVIATLKSVVIILAEGKSWRTGKTNSLHALISEFMKYPILNDKREASLMNTVESLLHYTLTQYITIISENWSILSD